jgi:hypothetical protein
VPPAMTKTLPMAMAMTWAAGCLALAVAATVAHGSCPGDVDHFVTGLAAGFQVAVERLLHGDLHGALEALLT